jgi:hypothetical protein
MARKPKHLPDDPEESARFQQAAIAAEVDLTGKAFKHAIGSLIPPAKQRKKKKGGG